jgi:hypothetical protein
MKLQIQSVSPTLGVINADEARKRTLITIQDVLIKKIEREIIDHASRGHKHFMSSTVLSDSGLQFLQDHGYVVETCYDDNHDCLLGTFVSWE